MLTLLDPSCNKEGGNWTSHRAFSSSVLHARLLVQSNSETHTRRHRRQQQQQQQGGSQIICDRTDIKVEIALMRMDSSNSSMC